MYIQKIIKNIAFFSLTVALFFSFMVSVASAGSFLRVDSFDMIVGSTNILRASSVDGEEKVYFDFVAPDNSEFSLEASRYSGDEAILYLGADDIAQIGQYRVSARYFSEESGDLLSVFNVFSADLSVEQSYVSPKSSVISQDEELEVVVYLLDDNLNPISEHFVKAVSDDKNLNISPLSDLSDEEGRFFFTVSAENEVAATVSFFDLSVDEVLDAQLKVAVTDSLIIDVDERVENGRYLSVGNSAGPVSYLKFENIEENLYVGDTVSFTVSAYDDNDELVQNYDGELRFSVISDNYQYVTLPNDYEFDFSDQGSHTFSLATSFSREGVYDLEARDLNNPDVYGIYSFEVGYDLSSDSPDSSSDAIVFDSPIPGTYSVSVQTISGVADPGAVLKIFDNNLLLASLVADAEGNFNYTTPPLVDGQHVLKAVSYVDDSEDSEILDSSDELIFNIDTDAPELLSIEISKVENIKANESLSMIFTMSESLSSAYMLVNGDRFELSALLDNKYSLNFNAPQDLGIYDVSLNIVDLLGNEIVLSSVYSLEVSEEDIVAPPRVSSLYAEPYSSRVTLTWASVDDYEYPISFYRVYYGVSESELVHAVDTFTDSNTWYIPNLENGTRYYFAVKAVDENGVESAEFSNVVSAFPSADYLGVVELEDVEDPELSHGVAGEENLANIDSEISDSGPEFLFFPILSFILGFIFLNLKNLIYS